MATTIFTNGQGNKQKRTVASVRRRGESRQEQRARTQGQQGSDNSDIDAIFRGVNSTRGMVRRGYSGQVLNPDGTDPGNSFDRFMKQNPHLMGASTRQAQYDAQAKAESAARLQSVVNERKALQAMQQPQSNVVTGADGYRTIFDASGRVIGTTAPVKTKVQDDVVNRGLALKNEQQDFANALQQAGMNSATSKAKKLKGLDAVFPGQSSPPGGASSARVGAPQVPGEPGGETLFGQLPAFQSAGMSQGIQYGPKQPVQQKGWESLFNVNKSTRMPPNAGPQYTPMMPNDGPQLPYTNPNQIEALRTLNTRGALPGRQPETGTGLPTAPSRLRFDMTNYFPGNDFNYLQTLFPGTSVDQILQLIENPAYSELLK